MAAAGRGQQPAGDRAKKSNKAALTLCSLHVYMRFDNIEFNIMVVQCWSVQCRGGKVPTFNERKW